MTATKKFRHNIDPLTKSELDVETNASHVVDSIRKPGLKSQVLNDISADISGHHGTTDTREPATTAASEAYNGSKVPDGDLGGKRADRPNSRAHDSPPEEIKPDLRILHQRIKREHHIDDRHEQEQCVTTASNQGLVATTSKIKKRKADKTPVSTSKRIRDEAVEKQRAVAERRQILEERQRQVAAAEQAAIERDHRIVREADRELAQLEAQIRAEEDRLRDLGVEF